MNWCFWLGHLYRYSNASFRSIRHDRSGNPYERVTVIIRCKRDCGTSWDYTLRRGRNWEGLGAGAVVHRFLFWFWISRSDQRDARRFQTRVRIAELERDLDIS